MPTITQKDLGTMAAFFERSWTFPWKSIQEQFSPPEAKSILDAYLEALDVSEAYHRAKSLKDKELRKLLGKTFAETKLDDAEETARKNKDSILAKYVAEQAIKKNYWQTAYDIAVRFRNNELKEKSRDGFAINNPAEAYKYAEQKGDEELKNRVKELYGSDSDCETDEVVEVYELALAEGDPQFLRKAQTYLVQRSPDIAATEGMTHNDKVLVHDGLEAFLEEERRFTKPEVIETLRKLFQEYYTL